VSGARRTAQAVEAAVAVAATHGLRCDEPIVLAHHSNALVHLRPAPIVARVATVTAPFRPGSDWLRREVAVAGYLAAGGAPVLPPSDLLPPGPHEHEGLHLTFWQYVDVRGEVDPAAAGASLHEIHRLLHGFTDELPSFDPLPETERLLDTVPLQPGDRALLGRARTEAAATLADLSDDGHALHGDAHLSNVVATPGGQVWLDLEDACTGPVEWDLACLVTATRLWGNATREAAALAAYGDHDSALVEALVPVRALFSTAWGLYALAQGARDPSRTAHRLAWWRQRYS
jgi:Phosphotransferase enzyme family